MKTGTLSEIAFIERMIFISSSNTYIQKTKKLTLALIFSIVQICSGIISIIIDKSHHNGHGEGRNQEIANLVSNVEFYIKSWLGIDDIVNYNFRIYTFLMGVAFWLLVGLLIDLIRNGVKKHINTRRI